MAPFLLVMTPYDVKWRHLTRHLGFTILDFPIFLKSQEIMEISTKSSHNAYKMCKCMNFCNLRERKTTKLSQKRWFLAGPTWNLMVAMATSNMMDTQMTYQNFCRECRKSYWKFQPLRVNRLFKTWKTHMGCGIYTPPPLPLVRPRANNSSNLKVKWNVRCNYLAPF